MAKRSSVLIVDDTPGNIQVLVETLKSDFRIQAATSGATALHLAAKEPRPDLILLDVMMPGMDGYEVCRRLKAEPETRGIPVIFVTALTEVGDEAKGLELGAVDYLTKPVNPSLVLARVRNQIELKLHRDRLEDLVKERTQELLVATAEKQKLATQLEMARDLQQAMLPARRHSGPRSDLAAVVEPATMVGGDLYDYFTVGERHLVFLVGDVSGKGVPAALFMMRALTVIRAIGTTCTTPSEILLHANRELTRDNHSVMFVTAVCGRLDLETGDLALASAGHEMPLLLGPGRSCEPVPVPGAPPLGIEESSEYPEKRIRLETNQTLLLYTDGVTDAEDPDRRFFSFERLLEVAPDLSGPGAAETVEDLLGRVRTFARGAPQSDDLTLLALRRR